MRMLLTNLEEKNYYMFHTIYQTPDPYSFREEIWSVLKCVIQVLKNNLSLDHGDFGRQVNDLNKQSERYLPINKHLSISVSDKITKIYFRTVHALNI